MKLNRPMLSCKRQSHATDVDRAEPIWTTTHGGYTLALANNRQYYADVLDGPPGAVWSGPNQAAWVD